MKNPRKRSPLKAAAPESLVIKAKTQESDTAAIARAALTPAVQAGMTLRSLPGQIPGRELNALIDQLTDQQALVRQGDQGLAEDMLVAQSQTLDGLFHTLIQKALDVDNFDQFKGCLHLALKAQSHARNTLATLAQIQNPASATFVKQANVQVNNGTMPDQTAHLPVIEAQPTQLAGISRLENELCPNP